MTCDSSGAARAHRVAAVDRSGEVGRLNRLPTDLWRSLLADAETVERYHAKVYGRGSGLCWYWLGPLSGTGHGRLRRGTRALEPGRPEDALAAIEEATDTYRELAAGCPDAFRPDLAMSLNNLSLLLADLGGREDALAAIEEGLPVASSVKAPIS